MPSPNWIQWRTVRVFISSTFRDMHAERDQLVKVVFPAVRERLQRYRLHLVDIDLRWGVTEQQSESDKALELCLHQVDASRPFFLGILGERYGYTPERLPPSTIAAYPWLQGWPGRSVTELEVRAGMRDPGMGAKPIFFIRDPSFIDDVPSARRGDVQVESDEARSRLDELKQVVCSTSQSIPAERFACTYRGLRVNPRLLAAAWPAEAAGVLDRATRDGLVEPAEYAALDPGLQDIVSANGVVYTGNLDAFGRCVEDRLWTAIRDELALPDDPPRYDGGDSLGEEAQYHDAFIESRLRVHVERPHILRRLIAHALGAQPPLLVLTGPPGSGKSSLMSRAAAALNERIRSRRVPNRRIPALVISHFIGASPQSPSVHQMLRRFCLMLDGLASGRASAPPSPAALPDATDELIETFRARLQAIPSTQPVVFIIDGVNQLDPADNAHGMHWLPRELPAHVRVIVSSVEDGANEAADRHPAATNAQRVLAALQYRRHRRIEVTPLTGDELLQIVRLVPSLSAKTLDDRQIALLLDNPAARNPLFLLVALEELRGFGSFERLSARIAAFPRQGDTLTQIFQQVIERLEEEFGVELVQSCLSFLAASRFGLSERELGELVVDTHDDEFRHGEGMATLYAVLRQIRAYTQYRGPLLDFFHANFKGAVLEGDLASSAARAEKHRALAAYFRAKADPESSAEWSGDSPRALGELPHHLAQAGDTDALRALVLDGAFLQAKLLAFDPQTLIDDFNLALTHTIVGSPEFEVLTEFRDALRLSIRQLAGHPAQLLTQLHGRVNREVVGVATTLQAMAAKATNPWLRVWTWSLTPTGPLMWQTRTRTRGQGRRESAVSLTPDAARIVVASPDGSVSIYAPDSGVPLVVLEGDRSAGAALDIIIGNDGRTATLLRGNGLIEAWDLVDEALLHSRHGTKPVSARDDVTAFAFDGTNVMLGTQHGAIEWFRVDDHAFVDHYQAHSASVSAIGFNAGTSRVVTSHDDGRLIVCEMTPSGLVARDGGAGAPALTFGGGDWAHASFGESPAFAWAVSSDGSAAFAGHAEKIYSNLHGSLISSEDVRGLVSQVDLESGKVTARLEVDPASPVIDVDVTPDHRFWVTLTENGAVKLWDWRRKDRQVALGQHNESDPVVAITPDGRRVLSAADDGILVVWELTTGSVLRLRGSRDHAFGIRVSPDSHHALVISAGYCNVWDLKSLKLGSTLGAIPGSGEEYTVWIRDAVVLPSNDRAVTVTGRGVVTTWDMKTGKPIGEPYSTGHAAQEAVFSTSGRWLLIAPSPDRLVLYNLSQHVSMREYALPAGAQVSSMFPAGDVAAFRIEVSHGESLFWAPEHDAPVPHPDDALGLAVRAATADGRHALGFDGATVTLIDRGANAALATYTADSRFSSFALSPDGQIAALGDVDKGVHVLVLEAAR